jgi:hypothetical protein
LDVLRRDRQLAAANIVRSCPDDWKLGDGAALACMTHRSKHNQNSKTGGIEPPENQKSMSVINF